MFLRTFRSLSSIITWSAPKSFDSTPQPTLLLAESKAMADSATPIPYTANPVLLFVKDLWLFVRNIFTAGGILSIVIPVTPTPSGSLDELYPSRQNIWAILLHAFLVVVQLLFLASLVPFAIGIPLPILYFLYVVFFILGNEYFTVLLNGKRNKRPFQSNHKYVQGRKLNEHEKWVFINGVAVGYVSIFAKLTGLLRCLAADCVLQ